MFASKELAERIEQAECRLLSSSLAAISRTRPEADTFAEEISGGLATYSGPGSPLNKVAGLGFGPALDLDRLEHIEQLFGARGGEVQVELATLGDASVAEALTVRGYRLVGFENVLGQSLASRTAPPDLPAGVTVEADAELELWLDTVVSGFMTPDVDGIPAHESYPREVIESVLRDMAAAEGVQRYLARWGGEPAGAGSLGLDGSVAQLNGASTLPAKRRRGVQAALLARRLEDARAAGCEVAVVTTQPGSTSQHNVQRRGFHLLYARAVLQRAVEAS